jgi:hypothetical protein
MPLRHWGLGRKVCVRGDSDTNILSPQLVLDLSVKKKKKSSVANCWAEGKGRTSRSQEEKADTRKERGVFYHSLEEQECKSHVRSGVERARASTTGR